MKIGKITLDGYFNYGNLLQSYALQKKLKQYADQVDTIWHSKNLFLPDTFWKWTWREPIKYIINRNNFRINVNRGYFGREMIRQAKLRDWADRYIFIRKNIQSLKEIKNEYDYFVVGSDQVWNPVASFELLEKTFLLFAPKEKRLSYAASISAPEIPQEKTDLYKKGLTEMQSLSLREQAGAELVEKICGRKAEVHVDPTLLLTPDEWRAVSRPPAWYHGKDYIVTYFLGNRPTALLKNLSKETGLLVVNLLDDNVYEHYVTGVDEFIWAIEHAKLVYTDSFHGTVFSILFRTPFVVCNRLGDNASEKMGSRIDTLLDYFGLQDRRGTKENGYVIPNPLQKPDWSQVEPVLTKERKRSADYLERVLHTRARK